MTDKDLEKTRILSGHDEIKDVQRYVRVSGIMEAKQEIKERIMDNLTSIQKVPILSGQKRLLQYFNMENK